MYENSDDYDFIPAEGSKLASLFGVSQPFPKNEPNNSLMYKPPKQPNTQKDSKDSNAPPKTIQSSKVLIAKAVGLWKLENNSYKSLGIHGLALIGSTDLNLYEIICYKQRSDILFRSKINENLIFYIQKDNFSSFYDSESQNWLIKFQNEDQLEFCKSLEKFGAKILEEQSKPELPTKLSLSSKQADQSDSSESQKRANILNRMAKMGQSILPNVPGKTISSDSSESDVDEPRRVPPRKTKRPIQDKPLEKDSVSTSVSLIPAGFQGIPAMVQDQLSQYIMLQNAELKMNLTQISSKLDGIINKKNPDETDTKNISKIKTLQLKIDNLEEALRKSDKRYSKLEIKYQNLLEKSDNNQEFEIKINDLQKQLLQLTMDNEISKEQLRDIEDLKKSVEEYKLEIENQEKIIQSQKFKLKTLEEFYESHKEDEALSSTVAMLNNKIENLKLKINDYEGYYRKIESENQQVDQKRRENINKLGEMVKKHMNDMYQTVLDSFDEDETYNFKEIQAIVAKQVKGTTFKVIEGCIDVLKDKELDCEKQ